MREQRPRPRGEESKHSFRGQQIDGGVAMAQAGAPAGSDFTSFFHINNPAYFPIGSPVQWPTDSNLSGRHRASVCHLEEL